MSKLALSVVALLAAAVSTSAVAKDLKQNKQAVSATQMSNSEMDRVTAGFVFRNGNGDLVVNPGQGNAFGINKNSGGACCKM